MDKCDELEERITSFLVAGTKVRPIKKGGCLLQLPFRDSDGDPIQIAVHSSGDSITLTDAGMVAGHLFTLGQHTQDTPAFKLLLSLGKAYGFKLDYDNGRLATVIPQDQIESSIMDFSKVILTMVTAIPHIRVEPHRLKPTGPRLRIKIRDHYKQADILDLVEHDYYVPGVSVDKWPVEFHWWLRKNGSTEHVYVVAVDLDVIEAVSKAARITMLALDAKRQSQDKLRIVLDSHGEDSNATTATSLIRNHSGQLRYNVYDFGKEDERQSFVKQSRDEITGEFAEPWRDFWQKQRVLS